MQLPNPRFSNKAKAVFLTILAGALWGTSFPIIKIGLKTIDPFTFVFWRFFISCVTLVAVMLLLKKIEFKITNKKILILLGIANAAGYLLQYIAMPYTTAAKAALFINLSAMWVALLSPRTIRRKLFPQKSCWDTIRVSRYYFCQHQPGFFHLNPRSARG